MKQFDEPQLSPEETLTQYLTLNGLRRSLERYAVLEAVGQMEGLFTVADLYAHINGDMNFRISLAAVYSTLDLLTDCRLVVKHVLSSEGARFEYAYGKRSFSYMICSKCGRITPVNDRGLVRTLSSVKTPRMHVTHYKTYIYGICASCASKEKARQRKIKANKETRKK